MCIGRSVDVSSFRKPSSTHNTRLAPSKEEAQPQVIDSSSNIRSKAFLQNVKQEEKQPRRQTGQKEEIRGGAIFAAAFTALFNLPRDQQSCWSDLVSILYLKQPAFNINLSQPKPRLKCRHRPAASDVRNKLVTFVRDFWICQNAELSMSSTDSDLSQSLQFFSAANLPKDLPAARVG